MKQEEIRARALGSGLMLAQTSFFSKPLVFLFPCDKETGWNFYGALQLCMRLRFWSMSHRLCLYITRYKWKRLFQNVGDSYHGVMSPARKGLDLDIRFLT